MGKLIWNVYIENFNHKEIEVRNIFECSWIFQDDLIKIYKKYSDNKEKFLDDVKKALMHTFWSRCEWEIILSSWPPRKDFKEEKIDVYNQIMINWDIFSEYIWNNRELIKNFKTEE